MVVHKKKKRIYRSSLTNLKVIRRLRGLTLIELSQKTGVGDSFLSRLEHGDRRLNKESIIIIARALKIDPAILLEEFPSESFDTYIDIDMWRGFLGKFAGTNKEGKK